ncbi:hypothetical protein SEA_TRIBUTE_141 [Streptomyces phage Tribute]|uniref:Uncharacterized protein n=4 Tax=Samistivirus peebs TaxID=2560790 RepID=A0A5Q2WIP6_9CAUD|nr:hypothetical protein SEA_SUSHI23_142 [Streptomyces phage Sushi23]QGH78314.1 hypothetical protein SEA_TRIBUTE_141 [Streptomyces phage Tribute]WNN95485.1 hypothetical protein SEA_WATERMOORE_141 [Streptomyces phage Watermoore]
MNEENGTENGIMTELVLRGILQVEEVEENGDILLSLDWDALYEYNPDIYLYLRTAELNGQMIQ